MLDQTAVQRLAEVETQMNGKQPEPGAADEQQSVPDAAASDRDPRSKTGSAKLKIEKTREDTSRAAGDILRRMMDRRPK